MNGLLLVVPVWGLLIVSLCRPPHDVVEFFVYVLMTSLCELCMVAFLIPKPVRPDRYELVFPPLDGERYDRYDRDH